MQSVGRAGDFSSSPVVTVRRRAESTTTQISLTAEKDAKSTISANVDAADKVEVKEQKLSKDLW